MKMKQLITAAVATFAIVMVVSVMSGAGILPEAWAAEQAACTATCSACIVSSDGSCAGRDVYNHGDAEYLNCVTWASAFLNEFSNPLHQSNCFIVGAY